MPLCLAILILIPLVKKRERAVADPLSNVGNTAIGTKATEVNATPGAPQATVSGSLGIVISQDKYDRPTHTVRGILKNNSDQSYENVVVTYWGQGPSMVETGTVKAIVPRIAAHQTATFETEPLPGTTTAYGIRDIQTMPR